jgi:hypothetical protein
MEDAMPQFFSSAISATLVVAALVFGVVPAGAMLSTNMLSTNMLAANAVAPNGVPASARIATGSALSDLNGVAIEAVILPEAAVR